MVNKIIIGASLSKPQSYHVYGGGGGGGEYCCGWTTATSQARAMTSTGTSSMGGAQPGRGHLAMPLASYVAISGRGYTSTPCAQ